MDSESIAPARRANPFPTSMRRDSCRTLMVAPGHATIAAGIVSKAEDLGYSGIGCVVGGKCHCRGGFEHLTLVAVVLRCRLHRHLQAAAQ